MEKYQSVYIGCYSSSSILYAVQGQVGVKKFQHLWYLEKAASLQWGPLALKETIVAAWSLLTTEEIVFRLRSNSVPFPFSLTCDLDFVLSLLESSDSVCFRFTSSTSRYTILEYLRSLIFLFLYFLR